MKIFSRIIFLHFWKEISFFIAKIMAMKLLDINVYYPFSINEWELLA